MLLIKQVNSYGIHFFTNSICSGHLKLLTMLWSFLLENVKRMKLLTAESSVETQRVKGEVTYQ